MVGKDDDFCELEYLYIYIQGEISETVKASITVLIIFLKRPFSVEHLVYLSSQHELW